MIEKQKQFILKEFSSEGVFLDVWRKINAALKAKRAAVPLKNKVKLLRDEIRIHDLTDRATIHEVATFVRKFSTNRVDIFARNGRTMYDKNVWRMAMIEAGWIDEEKEDHPVFVAAKGDEEWL